MSHQQQKGNILVLQYEGGVEPEVERNVFVAFWQTLNGEVRRY